MEESTNRILEDQSLLPVRGLASTKSRLVMDCADEDTEAVYTCVAESVKERVVASTYVNVNGIAAFDEKACALKQNSDALAAIIFTWSGTYIDAEGNDAVLLCRAAGNPAPKVTWFNSEDEPITSGSGYQVIFFYFFLFFFFFFIFSRLEVINRESIMSVECIHNQIKSNYNENEWKRQHPDATQFQCADNSYFDIILILDTIKRRSENPQLALEGPYGHLQMQS